MSNLSDFRTQRINANKHTERGIKALDNSISKDGWIGAVTVAADGETFDGSARLEALADAMPSAEPIIVESDGTRPVIVRRTDIPDTDDPRAKRLGVAANVIAHMDYAPDGEILAMIAADDDAVARLIKQDELSADAVAAALADGLLGDADAEPQIDRAAELNEKWQVQRGDLWRIGEHRLLCGDSTVRGDVERVMGGELPGAIITDPPYNIGKDKWDKIDDFVNWIRLWFLVLPNVTTFVFTGSLHCGLWWMVKPPRALYCWHKPNGQGNNPFGGTTKWEPILVWNPPHDKQTDFIEHNNEYGDEEGLSDIHLTPKPVGLIQKLIQKTSGIVDDYFAGTGVSLVACENLQRKCRAIEISPNYCAVILERMATAFPGIEIERVSNGTA